MRSIQRSLYRVIHYVVQRADLSPKEDSLLSFIVENTLDGVYGTTEQTIKQHITERWKPEFDPPTWDQIIQILQTIAPLIVIFLQEQ